MDIKFKYVIKFVSDMNLAINFYRDRLGLKLKYQSSEWSEFETGPTTLALHVSSPAHPAGSAQLGFGTDNIDDVYKSLLAQDTAFPKAPEAIHGIKLAEFLDSENSPCSLSGPIL